MALKHVLEKRNRSNGRKLRRLMLLAVTAFALSACANTTSKDSAGADSGQESTKQADSQSGQVNGSADQNAKADSDSQEITEYSQEVFAMDTYMTVTAYGAKAQEAVEESISEIQRLDNLWSVGNAESEIAQINENGSLVLSEETATLIEESLDLYKETDGKFDITIYPLMVEWGFTSQNYKVPAQERIEELLAYVDADAIEYNKETRELKLPEHVQIDLGGIAKGYTSAHIMDIFAKYDIVSGLVSLGGNVQTYGTKTDGSNWKVGVENPDQTVGQLSKSDYVGVIQIADKAVITSGGYERYFEEDGVTYHHIIDPDTGKPANNGLISVTIVSDDGLLADGLSTSLFIMGKEKAIDFWREHSDQFDTILVDDQGGITVTAGLKEAFDSELDFDIVE